MPPSSKQKVICDICGKPFSPQGLGSHRKACQRAFTNDMRDSIGENRVTMGEIEREEGENHIPSVLDLCKQSF